MEAITGEMLVAQARMWIGTPHHHAGRVCGVGVDCFGLVSGAVQSLGLAVPSDTTAYGRGDNLALLTQALSDFSDCLSDVAPHRLPGDIMLFRGGRIVHHIAICTGDETMIHVSDTIGIVTEQALRPGWEKFLFRVYRLRSPELRSSELGSC